MPGIDDPIDAVKKQHPEQPDRVLDLILNVAGALAPYGGVVNAIRQHFSADGANVRTRALLDSLEEAIRDTEASIHQIRQRMESPQFIQALIVAVTESIRTPDPQQIRRFGAVLGGSAATGLDFTEAAALIRDLAQLTESDLEAVRILYSVQKPVVAAGVVTTDANRYTETVHEVLAEADRRKIPRDEFYARCARLSGFGLALEVQRNEGRFGPGDHCFRLTKRAALLVSLLGGAIEAVEA